MLLGRSLHSPHMVGRESQLAVLGEIVADTRIHRRANTILITGEAGIGKTRLARQTEERAREQGFLTLRAECFEFDESVPYAPVLELFDMWLRTAKDPAPVLAPLASVLVKWLPALTTVFPNISPAANLDPEQERYRLFHTLTDFLIRQSEVQPLFILVEDLHWCDETSLHYWLYLARHTVSCPIIFMFTYRSEQLQTALHRFLSEIDRRLLARELPLDRLTRLEVGQMIGAILGKSGAVQNSLIESIYLLSEGNPLMVEEMLQVLISSGDLLLSDGQWSLKPLTHIQIPRTIQGAVERRAATLTDLARRALSLAAVMGRGFDFGLLQKILALDEQEMLSLMKELIGAQLVVEESTDRYAFRHALTRQAIYSRILGHERTALHLAIADAIERKLSINQMDSLDTRAGEVAYHFYAARVWDKALLYSRRAGEAAQALYAPHEAIEYFTHALEAASEMSLPPPIEITRARGKAYETAGEFEAARSDYEQLLRTAEAMHDSTAEWQGLIDLGVLWASRDYDRTGEYFRRALELARKSSEPSRLAHSLNQLGNWCINLERPQEALQLHQEALTIFEQLNDLHGLAATLDLLGLVSSMSCAPSRAADFFRRAVALFEIADDRKGLASSLAVHAERGPMYQYDATAIETFPLTDCTEDSVRSLSLAREIGWRAGEAFALITLAENSSAQGKYSAALGYLQSALDIAGEIGHGQWMCFAHLITGIIHLEMLSLPEAQSHLEQAQQMGTEIKSVHWEREASAFLVAAYILQNNAAGAQAVLEKVIGPETPFDMISQRQSWVAAARLALCLRQADRALEILERLAAAMTGTEYPLSSDARERAVGGAPRFALLYGEALITSGREEAAERVWQSGLEAAKRLGTVPLLWRFHLALGKLYRSRRLFESAEDAFASAREVVAEVAAEVDDEALRDNFLRSFEALIPTPRTTSERRQAKRVYGGLTKREREVAGMIGSGRTNREMAQALSLSERTIESHVSSILNKLGFTSRAQIVAWSYEKGLRPQAEDQ